MPKLKTDPARYVLAGMDAILVVQRSLPKDHEFYALIGRVAAEWAHLEHMLDLTIWDLTGTAQIVASCVTGQMMGHTPRFNALAALAAQKGHSKDTLKKIETLRNEISNLAKDRNRYVHDAWFVQTDDNNINEVGQFKSFSDKGKLFGFHPIPASDIEIFIEKIRRKTDNVSKLRGVLLGGQKS